MEHHLEIPKEGALVTRLDPGVTPFRKATEYKVHVSGGEFNWAANLADTFALRTAMVNYPVGDLVAERVRAMGVKAFTSASSMMECGGRTRPPFTGTADSGCGRLRARKTR
jgi:hypothetical protein